MTTRPTLIIVRGIPGSGKSTFAATLAEKHGLRVFEADDYFMKESVFVYNGEDIPRAHKKCRDDALREVFKNGAAIVANTEIRWSDLKQIIRECADYRIWVTIFDVVGDFGSIHGVPEIKMKKLKQGFAMFPSLIPFFLRDGYDPRMIARYGVVTPVRDGEPIIEYKQLDFSVEPAPPVRR